MRNANYYGLQFHPEVSHTRQGKRIFERFVLDICRLRTRIGQLKILLKKYRKNSTTSGNDHVILGLSGGVDSSVVAALLHKAIGDQLTCVFVDTGLLRLNEAGSVRHIFAKHVGICMLIHC